MRQRIESLFHACAAGDLAQVKAIIDEGDHNVDGENRWSTDIDPRGWQRSPVFAALIHGHLEVAKWLLEQGAKPDQRSKYGDTALNALLYDPKPPFWLEASQLLLAHGADVTIANDEGETPLDRMKKHAADWERIRPLVHKSPGQ